MSEDKWGKCIARTFNESGADGWWIPQSEVEKLEKKLEIAKEALKFTASGPWLDNAAVKYCEEALSKIESVGCQ